jgi:hypothetical protein
MPLWYVLLTAATCVLSCTSVVRRWPWMIRVALHAGWVAMTILAPLFEKGSGR